MSRRRRTASTPALTAVVLLGDPPPVPAEDRVAGDDAGHPRQCAPAEFPAAHRESTALGIGQAKGSSTTLLSEDAILFPEVVDQIFVVAIHPASDGEQQELQRMRHHQKLLGRDRQH